MSFEINVKSVGVDGEDVVVRKMNLDHERSSEGVYGEHVGEDQEFRNSIYSSGPSFKAVVKYAN